MAGRSRTSPLLDLGIDPVSPVVPELRGSWPSALVRLVLPGSAPKLSQRWRLPEHTYQEVATLRAMDLGQPHRKGHGALRGPPVTAARPLSSSDGDGPPSRESVAPATAGRSGTPYARSPRQRAWQHPMQERTELWILRAASPAAGRSQPTCGRAAGGTRGRLCGPQPSVDIPRRGTRAGAQRSPGAARQTRTHGSRTPS